MGTLIGGGLGAYKGYQKTGKFGWQTAGYTIIGAISGFAVGSQVGALFEFLEGMSIGSGGALNLARIAPKIVEQLADPRTYTKLFSLVPPAKQKTAKAFIAGALIGVVAAVELPDSAQEPTETLFLGAFGTTSVLGSAFAKVSELFPEMRLTRKGHFVPAKYDSPGPLKLVYAFEDGFGLAFEFTNFIKDFFTSKK